jgi:hypothetical protein
MVLGNARLSGRRVQLERGRRWLGRQSARSHFAHLRCPTTAEARGVPSHFTFGKGDQPPQPNVNAKERPPKSKLLQAQGAGVIVTQSHATVPSGLVNVRHFSSGDGHVPLHSGADSAHDVTSGTQLHPTPVGVSTARHTSPGSQSPLHSGAAESTHGVGVTVTQSQRTTPAGSVNGKHC